MNSITLSRSELMVACTVGGMRQIKSLHMPDKHGFDGVDRWTVHIEGAAGEMAVAKALNVYFPSSVNTFKNGSDLFHGIEIRTRSKEHYELIVRPDDNMESRFVLVTGCAPVFNVRGWIVGVDARREEWWNEYGERPGAWFVPQESLLPIEELVT